MSNTIDKGRQYKIETLEEIYSLMNTVDKAARTSYFICYFEEVRQRIEILKQAKKDEQSNKHK